LAEKLVLLMGEWKAEHAAVELVKLSAEKMVDWTVQK
jgi:hypothetical protein